MSKATKKWATVIAILLSLYCAAYGVARWRKFIVMDAFDLKEDHFFIRQTGPGFDIREDWRGHLKNKINPVLFAFFKPLELLENQVRGSKKPLSHPSSPPQDKMQNAQ